MADNESEIAIKLVLETDKANLTLGELEDGFAAMSEEIKGVSRGSDRFNELSQAMAGTSAELQNVEAGFEGLGSEAIAGQMGGLAGGIGDVTSALVVMGGENETMQEMAAGIETAMAISMGLKGAIEGTASATKLYNNLVKKGTIASLRKTIVEGVEAAGIWLVNAAKTALSFTTDLLSGKIKRATIRLKAKAIAEKVAAAATWLLNIAQKALNATLKLNPTAILITALTIVVGLIWYFRDAVWGLIKTALKPFKFIIDLIIDGLQAMGIMASDAANAAVAAGKNQQKQYEKTLEALEKLAAKEKERSDNMLSQIDREIQIAEAQGKSTEDLARHKLSLIEKSSEAELEALDKRIRIAAKDLELKRLDGDVSKEVYDEKVEQYHDLVKLQKESSEKLKDDNANLYAWDLKQLEARRQKVKDDAAEAKATADTAARDAEAAAKTASDKRTKTKEEEAKQVIAEGKALAEFEEEQAKIKIQLIQDEGERARAEIKYNSELELEALEKNGQDTFDARMLIAQEKNKALADLEKAEDDKRFALEKAAQDKRDEYDKLLFDAKVANEQSETERQKLQLEEDFQNNLATLQEQGLLTMELEFELMYAKEQALADIEDEFRIKKEEDEADARDKKFALASGLISSLTALNDAALATDLLNAAGNDEKQEKIRRASFERQKKLNIAMAAINGAQAVIAGFAQGGLPMAILAGVTAAAQLAAIVATTYQSSASPTEVDETVPTPDGAGGGGGGAQINSVTNTSTILGNQQVFVTETDITSTQNNVSVIEESATF